MSTTIKTKVLGLKAKSLQYLNDTLSVHLWCQIYWGAILGVLEFVFWFSSWCHLSMSLVWAASPTPGFLDSNSLLYQPPPRNHKFYPIAAGSNHHSRDQIPSQVGHICNVYLEYKDVIWVGSWRCSCLVTWFCYQLIAKPCNKTAAPPWPDLSLYLYI